MDHSDAVLVTAALKGDDGAYERLVRRHVGAVYVVALALTGSPQDAEDVCQDALITAYDRLRECRWPERFRAWLAQIVRHRAHNHRRWAALRRGLAIEHALGVAGDQNPHEDAERAELRAQLLRALDTLSATQREVVVLHDLEDLTHGEVAAALHISELMSRRHLSDARRKLRERLARTAR